MSKAPTVRTQMLIRRPVAEVFNAFIDPAVTTQFWFSRSSGALKEGAVVEWSWDMYGVSTTVKVKAIEAGKRILVEWGDPPCPVEWRFESREEGTTMVVVSNWGFEGSAEQAVASALDAMGGFSFMLAALKALLEHDIRLGLVGDHNPDAHVAS